MGEIEIRKETEIKLEEKHVINDRSRMLENLIALLQILLRYKNLKIKGRC